MFELKITANNPDELRRMMIGMLNTFKDVSLTPADAPQEAAPQDEPAPAPETPQEVPQNEAPAALAPQEANHTIDEVRAIMKKVRDQKGSTAVKSILKDLGIDNLHELKEEQYKAAYDMAYMEVG